MTGSHRTPGAPAPTRAQRRVAWCGPMLLLAFTAVLTMDALPRTAQAAATPARAASAAPQTAAAIDRGRSAAAALPGQPEQAPRRPPALLAAAQVLTGTAPSAVPTALVLRCRIAVTTGEDAARAGAASYRDWARHVQAQLDLDAGRATWLGAVQLWTATRSAGRGDTEAFARAVRRRAATAGACGAVAGQTSGALHRVVTGCQARSAALDRVIRAGARVDTDWAWHLATTTSEVAHAPGGPQAQPWLATVKVALPVLEQFRQAQAALVAAPPCRLG